MIAEHSTVLSDLSSAAQLALRHSRNKAIQSWLYVPLGILLILLPCFAVNKLFGLGSVTFPSSVACLVILFLALLLSEKVLGEHRTKRIVGVVEIPSGWVLRWINVLFTPSFVLLPLSPSIGGIEVLKMIAVFVIGFVVMMALAAYMTRGLQLVLGSSKRALTERAEELNPSSEEIPMTSPSTPARTSTPVTSSEQLSSDEINVQLPPRSRDIAHGWREEDLLRSSTPQTTSGDVTPRGMPHQAPIPPSRATRWAAIITAHIDHLTYAILFILVGLPLYYAVGYAMPMHLAFNILAYFAAMSLPPTWRTYLHPVLVSALLTVLGIWALGLIKGDDLHATLAAYKTGLGYVALWSGSSHQGLLPGAGDLFSSVLDAGIVSFALPVYQYRRELKQHFASILVPNVAISVGSLFAYPPLCYAIGISAPRSLSFTARSLTLALAIPAAANLGGDPNTVAALAIMSGIAGVLVGQPILRALRIPEDDYVTRGVTFGANSSAIGAALLLRTDPRAAALSILAMTIFGTITVLFTSIPPMASAIQSLVEL
ncbi:LrgB-like family-domain-containing protein [Hypoxylon fragiforme]|uniref:LrgB-like family-domain-containing protein n=1 Tax=Hypoxylon fragiforme TaxID=63214 RepID=UPI0020C68C1A|nr:LrgB-like family-domain-containing protein [Hypoxylon fragiforme]KAI2603597.1 LrgB-like family-domain-containing protein [Hypoxylon fragiforme]